MSYTGCFDGLQELISTGFHGIRLDVFLRVSFGRVSTGFVGRVSTGFVWTCFHGFRLDVFPRVSFGRVSAGLVWNFEQVIIYFPLF